MPPRPDESGATPPHAAVGRARIGIAATFFVNGCGFGSWVPHIPDVKLGLGLSDGVLGLALLAIAVGALVALPCSGVLTARFGSRAVTRAAAVLFCAVLPLPLLAPDLTALLPALALLGVGAGALDVAMNAHAVVVEERYGRPIMSSFHGLFSLGGLAGAALAGVAMHLGVSATGHLVASAVVLGIGVLPALAVLLPTRPAAAGARAGGPTFVLPRGRLILLGALALGGLLAEGAMGDWSAVYLRTALGADAGTAAFGFAAFSLAMAAGRLTGDRVVARLGPARTLNAGGLVAAAALAAALVVGHPAAALLGFAGVGLGLANLIPVVFSAAGTAPGVPAGIGIAAVSTAGYCGFLAGPPAIGFVAEFAGLPAGLGLVAATLALMALGSGALNPADAGGVGAPSAAAAAGDRYRLSDAP
jgi:predicted MFS family arabinose efflux permease